MKKSKNEYESWYTGGKGIHVHIFFQELKQYSPEERTTLKKCIIDYFFGKDAIHAKVDYLLCSRHLVRSEYGVHEKTNKFKTKFDEFSPRVRIPNKIPKQVLIAYKKEKDMYSQRKPMVLGTGLSDNPFPCISYLMKEEFTSLKDGRSRALTILAGYFYRALGPEGIDYLFTWNKDLLGNYFREGTVRSTYKSITRMYNEGRAFGCKSTQYLLDDFGVKEKICHTCPLQTK